MQKHGAPSHRLQALPGAALHRGFGQRTSNAGWLSVISYANTYALTFFPSSAALFAKACFIDPGGSLSAILRKFMISAFIFIASSLSILVSLSKLWGEQWGTIPQPSVPQTDALPIELCPPHQMEGMQGVEPFRQASQTCAR